MLDNWRAGLITELEEILRNVTEYEEGHHLRRPYLSAYQLAILYNQQYPSHLPVGGIGVGEFQSLAQYIARLLSQAIMSGECQNIDGGFISHTNLSKMSFSNNDEVINVSTLKTKVAHTIFRFVG